MELLRILAMFLVLIIHANTVFAPWPIGQQEVIAQPLPCFVRFLIEALSVVCVNSFILLSGWFGIKFSFRRLLSFVFQVLFFSLILAALPTGPGFNRQSLMDIFTLNQYWFVKAYIILFILSPALNAFAENAPRQLFRDVLIAFFLMQTVFAYVSNTGWFDDGFSPIPFIGLYLLARYVRIHQPSFSRFKIGTDIGIYLAIALCIAVLSVVLFKYTGGGGRLFNYTNPLVIVSSLYFVLIFSKLHVRQSKAVNWIAVSSVGAYLLHMNPAVFQPLFTATLRTFEEYSAPVICVFSFAIIVLVFFAGVLMDKVRIVLWRGIQSVVSRPASNC